jgi:hypothetical protein
MVRICSKRWNKADFYFKINVGWNLLIFGKAKSEKFMEIITIHPRTKEETSLFEHLAKTLNTPYKIKQKENLKTGKKKPSDYFGTLSKEDGKKMLHYVNESRNEWNRNT